MARLAMHSIPTATTAGREIPPLARLVPLQVRHRMVGPLGQAMDPVAGDTEAPLGLPAAAAEGETVVRWVVAAGTEVMRERIRVDRASLGVTEEMV